MIKLTHYLFFLVILFFLSPAISSTIVETNIGILHDDFLCSYLAKKENGVSEIDSTVYPEFTDSAVSSQYIQCYSHQDDGSSVSKSYEYEKLIAEKYLSRKVRALLITDSKENKYNDQDYLGQINDAIFKTNNSKHIHESLAISGHLHLDMSEIYAEIRDKYPPDSENAESDIKTEIFKAIGNNDTILEAMEATQSDFFIYMVTDTQSSFGARYKLARSNNILGKRSEDNHKFGFSGNTPTNGKHAGFIVSNAYMDESTATYPQYALSHEFGHLIGLSHDVLTLIMQALRNNNNIFDYRSIPYGSGFKEPFQEKMSVMAYKYDLNSYDDTNYHHVNQFSSSTNKDLYRERHSYFSENYLRGLFIDNERIGQFGNGNYQYVTHIPSGSDSESAIDIMLPQFLDRNPIGSEQKYFDYINYNDDKDNTIILQSDFNSYKGGSINISSSYGDDTYIAGLGSYRLDFDDLGNTENSKKLYFPLIYSLKNTSLVSEIEINNFDIDKDELYISPEYHILNRGFNLQDNAIEIWLTYTPEHPIYGYFDGDDDIQTHAHKLTIKFKDHIPEIDTYSIDFTHKENQNISFESSVDSYLDSIGIIHADKSKYTLLEFNDNIFEGSVGDDLAGDIGNSSLADFIYGLSGNDILGDYNQSASSENWNGNTSGEYGWYGDTFIPGEGNDTIYGTRYGDTYIFDTNSGHNTIYEKADISLDEDEEWSRRNKDILILRGFNYGDGTYLKITRSGYDVIIEDKRNPDVSVRIKNFLKKEVYSNKEYFPYAIERIIFTDTSMDDDNQTTTTNKVITEDEIFRLALTYNGAEDNDNWSALSGYNNKLYGNGGNDYLLASGTGVHLFDGGDGDDRLGGGYNNRAYVNYINNSEELNKDLGQTLIGGPGRDYLYGTKFGDTYYYNLGDGIDTIYEDSPNVNEFTIDRLIFGEGIEPEDIKIVRNSGGNNITLKLDNENYISLSSFYSENRQIEEVIFHDGTKWTTQYILDQGLIFQGTDNNDNYRPLSGYNNTLYGNGGNDYLLASGTGVHLFDGGDGNDTLGGGYGIRAYVNYINNSEELDKDLGQNFIGGPGRDYLYGTKFGDTYYYNDGDGIDTIYEDSPNVNEFTIDRLIFGEGIAPEDVEIVRNSGGNNITLKLDNENYILLSSFYSENRQIEEVIFQNGTKWTAQYILDQGIIFQGTEGNDTYRPLSGYNNTLYGYGGNDYLLASGTGVHLFDGGDGDDKLGGGYDNRAYVNYINNYEELNKNLGQTFIGGPGRDYLYGTKFGDTYYYNLSDGIDVIFEDSPNVNEFTIDRLIFGEGIEPEDIKIVRNSGGNNITLKLDNENYISLSSFYSENRQIEEVIFHDGTKWTTQYILDQGLIFQGTEDNDNYRPLSGYNNTLYGNGGNDYLLASGTGVHLFDGGDGDDKLGGGYDNRAYVNYINNYEELNKNLGQTFIGGPGRDYLYGTKFGDTYYYNLSDGIDVIFEDSPNVNEFTIDRLIFGEGIEPEDIKIVRNSGGNNITLKLDNENYISLSSFYSENRQIEEVIFHDGTKWTTQYILSQGLIFQGTEGNDNYRPLSGYNNTLYGNGGNDYLLASGTGVHLFDGGDGNDTLGGGYNNRAYVNYINNSEELDKDLGQTFIGGPGRDYLYGTKFGDTYYYNSGDGVDTIYEDSPHVNDFTVDRLIVNIPTITFMQEGNNLVLYQGAYIKGNTSNRIIIISNFYASSNYQIEQFAINGSNMTADDAANQGVYNMELFANQ